MLLTASLSQLHFWFFSSVFTEQCGVFSVTFFFNNDHSSGSGSAAVRLYRPAFPLSLTGPHSPHANTQLNTDEATLLDLSQLVSPNVWTTHCLSPTFSLSLTPLFWTCLHCSILSFYLSPISPHPIHHSAPIAPWEMEDGPSCCAQVCLSEVNVDVCVCACMRAWKREREWERDGIWKNTITEQVSFHLCRSQLTFPLSLSETVYVCQTHPVLTQHTFTQGRLSQGNMRLSTRN